MCLVFVVIPAYNAENFLPDCLDSLIGQTMTDWRAVVVDDGSKDGTLAVAQDYAKRDRRIEAHGFPNGGVATARNRGIKLAPESARNFVFLDNDDFLNPDMMQTLLDLLNSTPDAVAAYGLPRAVDAAGRPLETDIQQAWGAARQEVRNSKLRRLPDTDPTTFASFVVWPQIATPGQVLIRAAALRTVGEFDQTTVPSDDWDLWLRLSTLGDFAFLPRFVMNKRAHAENVSNKGKVMAVAEPVLREKLAAPGTLTPKLRSIARAGHRAACVLKFSWAGADLRKGRVVSAAKQAYRAARSYARYLRLWST